jgi:thioredoxin-like negative regulator of GroEL
MKLLYHGNAEFINFCYYEFVMKKILIFFLLLVLGFLGFILFQNYEIKTKENKLTFARKSGLDIIKLTDKNIQEEISKSDLPIVLVFYANKHWNPGLFRESPPVITAIKEISESYQGKVKFRRIEVNTNKDPIAKEFNIEWIPTVLFYKNGMEVERKEGGGCTVEEAKETIEKMLE